MAIVDLLFTRKARVQEKGSISVEIKTPTDWTEIEAAAKNELFKEFIITSREYEDVDWEFFEPIPEEDFD